MEQRFNEVYVNDINKQDLQKIDVDYVYLTVPAEWVCVYHKLLVFMTDFGEQLLNDCTASCKGNGKTIVNCWNMFQSAIASRSLGLHKQSEVLIKYIIKQLDSLYGVGNNKSYCGTAILPISSDGTLKAVVSCDKDIPEFYTDLETGELYQKQDSNKVFTIKDEELIVESDSKI